MTRDQAQPAWEIIVEKGFSNYDMLTREERVWFNLEPLTIGGLIDHYVNYGADHNSDTIEDLEYLGFIDIATLMRKFNRLFPDNKPPYDIDKRNDQIGEFDETIVEKIDKMFWERCDELENSIIEHINKTGIGIK